MADVFLTVKLVSGPRLGFARPDNVPGDTTTLSWRYVGDGVLAVVVSRHPKLRRRHIPVAAIDWWEVDG